MGVVVVEGVMEDTTASGRKHPTVDCCAQMRTCLDKAISAELTHVFECRT
jgi:hypothetical protein